MASSLKQIADPREAAVLTPNLSDILKERGIIVFSQNIRLVKIAQFNGRSIKVCLDIKEYRKYFTVYLDNEKTPVIAIDKPDQLEEACKQISDLVGANGILNIRAMLEELDAKKAKFAVPHSYYFDVGENAYIIDSGTTKERAANIKSFLKSNPKPHHILCSHYHPDHWANNVLLAAENSRIYVHYAAKEIFQHGYHVFMYNYMKKFFHLVDISDVIKRNLHLSRKMLDITDFFIHKTPGLAVLAFQFYNMKFVERFRSGKKHFYYLNRDSQQVFNFSKLSLCGWQIDDGLIALETPGHSYDHLAFYIVDKKTLFTGEIDVFLNPVSILDCPPPLIHITIDRMIKLVETEKIDLLLPSHYMPIYGNQNIIAHLNQQRDKLVNCYECLCKIVKQRKSWEWKDLMQVVYESPEVIIQEALRTNWPKTISNLDVYVIFVLRELGYILTNPIIKTWELYR